MLKENISKALSAQFNFELYSAYLYLSMSSYCNRKGLVGFANWFHVQAQEEMAHGMNIYRFILERGAIPDLKDVKASKSEFTNMEAVFQETLDHEQLVGAQIDKISSLALDEHDHSTYQFMQWYVNEQVEEISTADLYLQKLKHVGDNGGLLFLLDNELGTRTFVDPFAAQAN